MASVLLVNPTIRLTAPPQALPFGLATIAAVLRDAGHQVEVLDINGLRLGFDEVRRRLADRRYDIVAAGGLITTYRYLKQFLAAVRQAQPRAMIVVGGGVCAEPEVVLDHMPADVCVLGEGERTMAELAGQTGPGFDPAAVPGLAWKEGGRVRLSAPRPLEKDLDRFPAPAYDLFPMEVYNTASVTSGAPTELRVISSRGCPWNCTFCWHIFGQGMRLRAVEPLLEELDAIRRRYRVDSMLFMDENFTANRPRLVELCEGLIRAGWDRTPWSCASRADTINRELLALMRRAGCYRINFGVESGCQRMLDSMNKQIAIERIEEAFALCRAGRIVPVGTLIFGMPGEDANSVRQTVAFCRKIGLQKRLFFATPYPGTELYRDEAILARILNKYGTKDRFFEVLDDAADFVVNLTDMPDDEMLRLKAWADARICRHVPGLARFAWDNLRARGLRFTVGRAIRAVKSRLAGPGKPRVPAGKA